MSKTRLTITLTESILKKVDQMIDKKNIRNRSHAIEHLIQTSLSPHIKTAVILAGNKNKHPSVIRPLIQLNDQALIIYTLNHFSHYQVDNFIILCDQTGHKIKQFLDQTAYKNRIQYIFEDQPLGTAGALKNAQKQLKNQTFFLIHGDVLTNINLDDFARFHQENQALITMAVKPRVSKKVYDNVFIQGNRVVDFQQNKKGQTVSIVNTGVYIFEPEIFQYIPQKTPVSLERDVFPQLTQSQQIVAFPFQGVWFDVLSDDNYQEALKNINSNS